MDNNENVKKYKCYITVGCCISGKSVWGRKQEREHGVKHFNYDLLKKHPDRNGRSMIDFLIDLANSTDGDCTLDYVFTSMKTIKYIQKRLVNHSIVLVLFDISLDELYRHRENSTRHVRAKPKQDGYVEKIHGELMKAVIYMKTLDEFEKIIITDKYFIENRDESVIRKTKRSIERKQNA